MFNHPEDARLRRNRESLPVPHELLIEAPLSVGLLLDAAEAAGRSALVDAVADALDAGETAATRTLRREAGRVRGRPEPATLPVTVTFHRHAGTHVDLSRPHVHLDAGRTVTTGDGTTHPVDVELVRIAAPQVQVAYRDAVLQVLQDRGLSIVPAATPTGREVDGLLNGALRRTRRECRPLGKPLQIAPLDAHDEAFVRAKLYA